MNKKYLVLAYYSFTALEDPHGEVERHKKFLENRDATARIYLSEQGINGQLSAACEDAKIYMEWMHSRPEFQNLHFKVHEHYEQAFPRLSIKYRKQLVAIDQEVDISVTGEHVSPKKWKEMLESSERPLLLDVRNDYESKVGHFEGATLPACNTFREFIAYTEELCQKVDPENTPVMMCCTGGIRCEIYSSVLLKKGFKKVYQLDGGIINYGLEVGAKHWLGKLFVFDDRMTIPIAQEQTPVIGTCHHCQTTTENYYNCANMDCNELFLCCGKCIESYLGCCKETCKDAPRIRSYHEQTPHKPFRRKSICSLSKV